MILLEVYWTEKVNMLVIKCECECKFHYPSSYSLVSCPQCSYIEYWHDFDPKGGPNDEIYSTNYKIMENNVSM